MDHYSNSPQRRQDKKHEATLRSFDLLDGRELSFRPSESKRGFYRDATVLSSDVTEGFRMRFKQTERRMSKSILLPSTPRQAIHEEEDDQLTLSVSCALHLGVLRNARQLPCEHAFCLECLETLVSSAMSVTVQCPVCCVMCTVPPGGPAGWPPARLHNNIADILRSKQHYPEPAEDPLNKTQSVHSLHSAQRENRRRGSILQKADLLKSIYADACHQGENMDSEEDLKRIVQQLEHSTQQTPRSSSHPTPNTTRRHKSSSIRRRSSIDRRFRLLSEREVMKKCCAYQMRCHKKMPVADARGSSSSSNNMSPGAELAGGSPHPLGLLDEAMLLEDGVHQNVEQTHICGHISLGKGKKTHVCVDQHSQIVVHTGRRRSQNHVVRFKPFLGQGTFSPRYLRLAQDSIFVSGTVSIAGRLQYYCLVRCDFTGRLLARSQDYRYSDSADQDATSEPLLLGFDLDPSGERIFLAKPATYEIAVLNSDLEETSRIWSFEDEHLRPSYLCYCQKTEELWVTCSGNTLFCLNVMTNDYYAFEGERLFHSTPTHIVCTTDSRVIFLDEKEGRTFWVSNSCNCLCIQRLSLAATFKNFKPKLLQALSDRRIMIADEQRCYIGRPTRDLEMRKEVCCPVS